MARPGSFWTRRGCSLSDGVLRSTCVTGSAAPTKTSYRVTRIPRPHQPDTLRPRSQPAALHPDPDNSRTARHMHLIHRKTCRACGSSSLKRVIDLGEQFLQGSFVKEGKELPPLRKIALSLVRCDPTRDEQACGLLQLEQTVPPEILYSAYWYRSGTNDTMRRHLKGIADEAATIAGRTECIA